MLTGHLDMPGYNPALWHGHEMLFGFGQAMVAGFLTTAVPKWTSSRPLSGTPLSLLCAVWVAGRLGLGGLDLLFIPALLATLAPPLIRAKRYRNLIFIPILLALWGCDLAWHLEWEALRAQNFALGLFVLLVAIIGGRVIPFFTRSALKSSPKTWLPVEVLSWTSAALLPVCHLLEDHSRLTPVFALAAMAHSVRLVGWFHPGVLRVPLLWSLYAGYAWLVLGFALEASAAYGHSPHSAAVHAFTVGVMGGVGLAIMARASLGHSGRKLKAPPSTVFAFLCLNGAAVARIQGHLTLSGSLWTLSFTLFFLGFLPVWLKPRADGRPG